MNSGYKYNATQRNEQKPMNACEEMLNARACALEILIASPVAFANRLHLLQFPDVRFDNKKLVGQLPN